MEKVFEVKTQLIREVYIEPIKENEDYVFFKDIKTKYVGENKVGEEGIESGITLRSLIKDVKPNSKVDTWISVPWMNGKKWKVVGIPREMYRDILIGKVSIHDSFRDFNVRTYDPENYKYCLLEFGSLRGLATLEGKVIPTPVKFNYLSGNISETYFRLEEMLQYLLKNPGKFVPVPGESEIKITKIYSALKHSQIEFCYLPSQKEAEKLKGLSIPDKYKNVIEISGLGKFKKKN